MRIRLGPAAIVTALLCAGCAVGRQSHEELTAEVQRLALPGTPAAQAQAGLASAGFSCGRNYTIGKGDIMCDRDERAFLLTCVQHVLLSFDAQKSSVANLDVRGPYCAGL